jgi:V/A-type H+-transporting ATPase subunit K
MKQATNKLIIWLGSALLFSLVATALLWLSPADAAQAAGDAVKLSSGAVQWGFIAAALATGLSSLAAGYAVANVGSAAIGALAEKPELMGRVLIVIGLAEGIAIYGLIVSIRCRYLNTSVTRSARPVTGWPA